MDIGIEKTKRFFSNKDFKWFDKKEVRDAESLSPEDLKYIKGWTASPFGYGYIFYIGLRKLPDIFSVYLVLYIFFEVADAFVTPLIETGKIPLLFAWEYFLVYLLFWLASLYVMIFSFQHGRRLSWNRGRYTFSFNSKTIKWEDVEELRKSEKKWFRYNTIPSLLVLAVLLVIFFFVF